MAYDNEIKESDVKKKPRTCVLSQCECKQKQTKDKRFGDGPTDANVMAAAAAHSATHVQ